MKTNIIIQGDCLKVLSEMPKETVDLIYLDPPFFSNKNYDMPFNDKQSIIAFQDNIKSFTEKKKDEYRHEIESEDTASINKFLKKEGFVGMGTILNVSKVKLSEEERKTTDFWENRKGEGLLEYLRYMRDRLWHCHRVLRKTGSIYLHCDWHASHYLKIVMDEIFDYENFRNEIIWGYRTGGATKKRFSRKHDNILFYSKGKNYTFNCTKERVYYEKPFFNPQQDKDGRYYADVLPVDVWEIPAVINVSKERLGYPTQKPEALLERIINASSNKGDIILDPFAGCGTAIAVGVRLKRKVIGIDISPQACKVMRERLRVKEHINVEIIKDILEDEDIKKMNWFEFQRWACDKLKCIPRGKGTDKGIDGDGEIKEGDEIIPLLVQAKHWQNACGAPEVRRFFGAMANNDTHYGIIIANSFSKGATDQSRDYATKNKVYIYLITAKELLEPSFDVNNRLCRKIIIPEYAPWKKRDSELTEYIEKEVNCS